MRAHDCYRRCHRPNNAGDSPAYSAKRQRRVVGPDADLILYSYGFLQGDVHFAVRARDFTPKGMSRESAGVSNLALDMLAAAWTGELEFSFHGFVGWWNVAAPGFGRASCHFFNRRRPFHPRGRLPQTCRFAILAPTF